MSRYRALLGCGLVVGTIGLAACGSSSSSSSSSGAASPAASNAGASSGPANGSPYKIALLEPTTGPLSAIANQIVDAGKYAVAAINADGGVGGHPLQLQVLNTQLDPAAAASAYQQAATQNGALAALGPLISPEVNAAIPVARRTQLPMLIPGAADIAFTHPVNPLVFRFGSSESQDDRAMANLARHLGCTKVALLYDTGALGLSTKSDIAHDISHFTVSVQISETATDLTPALDKIKAAGAQCIIEGTDNLGGVGSMVRTMANIGYKVPVLGDSG
jgi:branched-chain amino acid transport system substrate-binding protein